MLKRYAIIARILACSMAFWAISCMPGSDGNDRSVMIAVMYRDPVAVREAVRHGRGLEDRNPQGDTPLLVATATGQYEIAEFLINNGANIWACQKFGLTAGRYAEVAALEPGSPEGDARQRVIALLKARGFPFPVPAQEDILKMSGEGRWPPSPVDGSR